jgi:hypothetical protein
MSKKEAEKQDEVQVEQQEEEEQRELPPDFFYPNDHKEKELKDSPIPRAVSQF